MCFKLSKVPESFKFSSKNIIHYFTSVFFDSTIKGSKVSIVLKNQCKNTRQWSKFDTIHCIIITQDLSRIYRQGLNIFPRTTETIFHGKEYLLKYIIIRHSCQLSLMIYRSERHNAHCLLGTKQRENNPGQVQQCFIMQSGSKVNWISP